MKPLINEKIISEILQQIVFHGASSAGIMVYKNWSLNQFVSTSCDWYEFYNNTIEIKKCHIAQ